jgi:hypothetical protein
MTETLARQARSDITTYTAQEITKVMDAWPCIYCKAAAQRRGSTNIGSGMKPVTTGTHWSMDMKGGYISGYDWGYDSVHVFECLSTGKGFICGFKAPHSAQVLLKSIQKLCNCVNARHMKVQIIRCDAGSVETSLAVETYCADKGITIVPASPKAQFKNPVERYIEVLSN